MRENNAVFWAMGKSWPLQKAQPRGAKLPANILISAIKGSDMPSSLTSGRVDSHQGNDKMYTQKGHQIRMRLAAAGIGNRIGTHIDRRKIIRIEIRAGWHPQYIAHRIYGSRWISGCLKWAMIVAGKLIDCQGNSFSTSF
jgi:hypothetical protein